MLRYASPYGPGHPFSRADQDWIAFIERRTAGRVRIEPAWSGSLLSADQSMLELRHGVADIGLVTPIYARGGAHLIRVQSGFYGGTRTIAEQVALYRCLAAGDPQFARELDGLKVLAVQGGSLPGILTRERPVRTLADLRGLRIRAPTELLEVLRHFGADPVNMPMGEVYSAMAKGVIDGVIAPTDTLKALSFAEIARHFTRLEIPRGAYPARAMGAARWAALPPDIQAAFEEGVAVWEQALEVRIGRALAEGADHGQQVGVRFLDVDAASQQAFDAQYEADGLRNARGLTRYGIDGERVFREARTLAARIRRGERLDCAARPAGGSDRPESSADGA